MKKIISGNLTILSALLVALVFSITSCGGGGSSSGGSGGGGTGTTVSGVVSSFNGVAFQQPSRQGLGVIRVARTLSDYLVASVLAGVAGVEVTIGTVMTVTNADGVFSLEGIVPGTYDLTLSYAGVTVSTTLTIPANAISVTVDDIEVEGNVIKLGKLTVNTLEDEKSDEKSADNKSEEKSEDDKSDKKSEDQASKDCGEIASPDCGDGKSDKKSEDQASNDCGEIASPDCGDGKSGDQASNSEGCGETAGATDCCIPTAGVECCVPTAGVECGEGEGGIT